MNIQIKHHGETKQVGNCDLNNGVYHSYRQDKMWKFNGFAITKCILEWLKARGVLTITCSGLTTNTSDYFEHGNEWNQDGDQQLVLSLDYFHSGGQYDQQTI